VVRWDTDLGLTGFIGCLSDKKDQEEIAASISNPAGEILLILSRVFLWQVQ
jgi:hypothetical protein